MATAARNTLKSFVNFSDDDLSKLIHFFETKPSFAKSCPLTWTEILSLFRLNPDISEREIYFNKGLEWPGEKENSSDEKGKHKKGKDKHKKKEKKEKIKIEETSDAVEDTIGKKPILFKYKFGMP